MKGGKRKGAGRPPQYGKAKVVISCRVQEETKAKIKEKGLKVGPMLDEMMKGAQ